MVRRHEFFWWECPGKGCTVPPVYDEDLARGTASSIPNVEVRP
jgi:hypothetical protein